MQAGLIRINHLVLEETIDLLVLLEFLHHFATQVSSYFGAASFDFLDVLVILQGVHKLLHLVVRYCCVRQIDMLNAGEFMNELCQKVQLLSTLFVEF